MSYSGPGAMVADAWSSWTEPVSVQRCPELEAGSVSPGGSVGAGGDPSLPGAGPRGRGGRTSGKFSSGLLCS